MLTKLQVQSLFERRLSGPSCSLLAERSRETALDHFVSCSFKALWSWRAVFCGLVKEASSRRRLLHRYMPISGVQCMFWSSRRGLTMALIFGLYSPIGDLWSAQVWTIGCRHLCAVVNGMVTSNHCGSFAPFVSSSSSIIMYPRRRSSLCDRSTLRARPRWCPCDLDLHRRTLSLTTPANHWTESLPQLLASHAVGSHAHHCWDAQDRGTSVWRRR